MKNKDVCRIPVKATYKVIDDEVVMTDAEYEDIPADVIARFLLKHSGISAILEGGDND
ncbi:MAG: hypothetical protein ACI4RN_07055 [Oscillospiraceae bacterium]